jgi:5-formyltetrahydrofolate cyclo-ligase
LQPNKPFLRKEALKNRLQLDTKTHTLFSKKICTQLHSLDIIQKATSIASYFSCHNEVDLNSLYHPLFSQKKLYFPRHISPTYVLTQVKNVTTDTTTGHFGILEPLEALPTLSREEGAETIDVWLVPGLAFDKNKNRLGFGMGIYDRFLAQAKGIKIGICFQSQLVDTIPDISPHDIKMDYLVTDHHNNLG